MAITALGSLILRAKNRIYTVRDLHTSRGLPLAFDTFLSKLEAKLVQAPAGPTSWTSAERTEG